MSVLSITDTGPRALAGSPDEVVTTSPSIYTLTGNLPSIVDVTSYETKAFIGFVETVAIASMELEPTTAPASTYSSPANLATSPGVDQSTLVYRSRPVYVGVSESTSLRWCTGVDQSTLVYRSRAVYVGVPESTSLRWCTGVDQSALVYRSRPVYVGVPESSSLRWCTGVDQSTLVYRSRPV